MDDGEQIKSNESLVPYTAGERVEKQHSVIDSIRKWIRPHDKEIHIDPCPEHANRDPFAILQLQAGDGERTYFFTDPISGKVEPRARWHFYQPDFFTKVALIREKEGGHDSTRINLYKNGLIGLSERTGGRALDVDYSEDGELLHINFEIYVQGVDMPRGVELYVEDTKKLINPGGSGMRLYVPTELRGDNFSFEYEDGRVHFVRREDGKVIDEAYIPGHVDSEDLQIKFAPNPLVRKPTMLDDTYDVDWKTLDPIQVAGIRWETLENDTFDSLSRETRA